MREMLTQNSVCVNKNLKTQKIILWVWIWFFCTTEERMTFMARLNNRDFNLGLMRVEEKNWCGELHKISSLLRPWIRVRWQHLRNRILRQNEVRLTMRRSWNLKLSRSSTWTHSKVTTMMEYKISKFLPVKVPMRIIYASLSAIFCRHIRS